MKNIKLYECLLINFWYNVPRTELTKSTRIWGSQIHLLFSGSRKPSGPSCSIRILSLKKVKRARTCSWSWILNIFLVHQFVCLFGCIILFWNNIYRDGGIRIAVYRFMTPCTLVDAKTSEEPEPETSKICVPNYTTSYTGRQYFFLTKTFSGKILMGLLLLQFSMGW